MKKMLCAAFLALLAVSAAPAFAATTSTMNDAAGVQRYNCCSGRHCRDNDQSGPYCDENGYCTYDRR